MVELVPVQTINQLLHQIFFQGVFLALPPDVQVAFAAVKTNLLDAKILHSVGCLVSHLHYTTVHKL